MVRYAQVELRPFTPPMQKSDFDKDFEIAFEVMRDDLGSELLKHGLTFEAYNSCNGSLLGVRNGLRGYDKDKIMSRDAQRSSCSNSWQTFPKDSFQAVPSPSLSADEESIMDGAFSLWDETEYNDCFTSDKNNVHSTFKAEYYSSEVSIVTGQIGNINLLNNTRVPIHDLHINFMDLKRLYIIKDLETDNQEKTTVFLKATCKIKQVQVYIKECHPESSPSSFVDPLALKSEFDPLTGLLTVYLNFASFPSLWLVDKSTRLQLYVVTQFEDGKSQCCCSSVFEMQESATASDCLESQRNCYQFNGYAMEEFSSELSSPTRVRVSSESDASIVNDEQVVDEPASISLLPNSELTSNNIKYELCQENGITHIQEQSEFPGLLKLVKRKVHRDPMGRRRANGFRSAEEAFQWVCGHCFFRRLKKSTVRSHVLRKVCHRNRRIFAESQYRGHNKAVFRRSNTFPQCTESVFTYGDMIESKTP